MIERDFLDLMRRTLEEIELLTEPIDEGVDKIIDEALEAIGEEERRLELQNDHQMP